MKNRSLVLIGLLLAILHVSAQTADTRLAVGVSIGKNEYKGDLGNGILNSKQAFYKFGGLLVAAYISPSFDLGLQGNYGDYGYFPESTYYTSLWGQKYEGTLFLHYKLNNGYLFNEDSKLSPFVELGWGLAGYAASTKNKQTQAYGINAKGTDVIVPFGAGLKYQFNKSLAVQYKFIYNFTNNDYRDNLRLNNHNDAFAEHSLSVIFSFGNPQDADRDGVPDKFDKCPNTPKGVKIDGSGCPLDSDGDGIPDYLDKCPNTVVGVKVDAAGCPIDSDGDGVPDYLDKCPDTPNGIKVNASGCPFDTDGDGVADYLDKCPNTAAGVKVDATGCPIDTDGDGVPDNVDKCPETLRGLKVDANGCPLDSDGDGVPDYLDKCPNVPGVAANKGCPEIKAEVKKIFAQALLGIQFEAGKDVIKKISNAILDKVVNVMKENPTYNLEINGHTDNQGIPAKNLELSQKRANAVKNYLITNGVDASKLTAKGFGQTVPVNGNKTPIERSKNRRVEFKVNF